MSDNKNKFKHCLANAHDAITMNNQNTTLLRVRKADRVYILHDNRVYAFKSLVKKETSLLIDGQSNTSYQEQNVILNILVTNSRNQ